MTAFEHISEPIARVLERIERQRRETIRDEAKAHAIIEPILEQQQIASARTDAQANVRALNATNAWDNLSDRDMMWWLNP